MQFQHDLLYDGGGDFFPQGFSTPLYNINGLQDGVATGLGSKSQARLDQHSVFSKFRVF
jgi:hypothetical protein